MTSDAALLRLALLANSLLRGERDQRSAAPSASRTTSAARVGAAVPGETIASFAGRVDPSRIRAVGCPAGPVSGGGARVPTVLR